MDISPIHVLLVDDDEEYYLLIGELLSFARTPFVVVWADSLRTACRMLAEREFHLLLVDYRLGDGTGVELMTRATAMGFTAPMIMLTGIDSEEAELEAMRAGASDYISKGRLDIRLLERTVLYAFERKRMTEALRLSEERLRTVVGSAPILLFSTDLDGVVTLIDGLGLASFDLTAAEMTGRPIYELYPHIPAIERNVRRALTGETFTDIIDFGPVVLDTRYSPTHDEQGRVAGMVGVGTDITARMRSERALRQSEEYSRRLIENAGDIIAVLEEDGTVRYESPAVYRILGYDLNERIGRPVFELIHPDDLGNVTRAFGEILAGPGSSRTIVIRYRHADGSWRWLETIGTNQLHDPSLRGVVVNARDISERILAEQERAAAVKALGESEENYRVVAETASDAILTIDQEGTILFVNNGAGRIFGYLPSDMIGASVTMLIPDVVRELHQPAITAYLATGILRHAPWETIELTALHSSGREIPIEVSIADYLRDGRHLFTGVARDISERKRLERERERLLGQVEEDRRKLDALINGVPGIVWETWINPVTAQGRNFVSPYVETMLGYHQEEWIAQPSFWLDAIHPEDRERMSLVSADDLDSGRSLAQHTYRMITRDGRVVWVEARLVIDRDPAGNPVVLRGIALDVTDRRNAGEALRESEERFRLTIDNSPIVVFTQDRDLRYTWIRNAELIYRTSDVLGKRDEELFDAAGAAELARGKRAIMETGTGVRSEVKLVRDGNTYHFDLTMEPLRDREGAVIGIACVAVDITERKKAAEGVTLFRTLIDQSSDAIFVIDPESSRILDANQSAWTGLGYGHEELLMMATIEVTTSFPDLAAWHDHVALLRETGSLRLEGRHRRADGSTFPVEVNVKRVMIDQHEFMVAVARDITERKLAELAVRRSQEFFQRFMDNIPALAFMKNADGRYVYSNRQLAELLGRMPEEVAGLTDHDLWPGDIGRQTRENDTMVRSLGRPLSFTERMSDQDEEIFSHVVKFPMLDAEGEPMIAGIAVDVTERIKAERRLEESQQLNNAILHSLSAHIAVIDRSGMIVAVNHAWERHGWGNGSSVSMAVAIGSDYLEMSRERVVVGAPGAVEALAGIQRVLAGELTEFTMEYPAHSPTARKWFLMSITALDRIGGAVVSHLDITERKLAELALQQSQERFLAFIDNSPVIFYMKDEAGRYIIANSHFSSLVGVDRAELIGMTDTDLWNPEMAAAFVASDHEVRATGIPIESQDRITTRGVERYWFSIKFLVPGESGQALIGGTAIEITGRVHAEASLRQSEERLQLVTRATNDAIWDWNLNDNTVWWNQNVHTLFGYSPDEMTDSIDFWHRHLHPDDRDRVISQLHATIDSGLSFWTADYRFRREDGSYAYVFDRGYVIHEQGKPVRMIGAIVDISDRKNAEEALRDSETKYRRIVETAQEGILVTDERGVITFVNARMAEILGFTVEEMHHTLYADYMDEEGRELGRLKANRRREGIAEQYDFKFIRKDGSPVWTIVSANPVFGKDGSIVGSLGMITDITDRKRAEEALQEAHDELEVRVRERTAEIVEMMARLAASHRMQKRFVADASHDLRTPLTVVQAEIDLLLNREGDTADIRRSLLRISAEAKRLNSLASDLLLLATLDAYAEEMELRAVQRLDELLLDAVANLSTLTREKQLAWSIRIEDPVELRCDPQSLDRALTNVLENAIKYSPEGSVITVSLELEGSLVRIVIADNGIGIPAEDLPKVFDRFYRSDHTRSTPGTGLGLAIARAVVEAHQGSISIESTTNVGTTLRITLPCLND